MVLFVQGRVTRGGKSSSLEGSAKRFEIHQRALTVEKEISEVAVGGTSNRDFVRMRAAGKRHA